ncbi:MAG TPA: hypothetical protein VMT85_03845 [Thermoanaerobaculia bacterium]|nr:hypothetical protein [Thermoanaerobaculia bacterium]
MSESTQPHADRAVASAEDVAGGDAAAGPPEHAESLWMITMAPLLWAVHFLASYLTAAIWCARSWTPGEGLGPVRIAILIYTVIALGGIVAVAVIGLRRHQLGTATVPHDFDTPEDRHRFLGFATLLLAGLSGVATLFVGATAAFFESCR